MRERPSSAAFKRVIGSDMTNRGQTQRAPVANHQEPFVYLEAPPRFELGIKDLQSSALPLGHGAKLAGGGQLWLPPPAPERETGLEPATPTLARLCSTN